MKNAKRAFTLLEILIAVTIVAVLSATVLPSFLSATDDAKLSALSSDIQSIRAQLEIYRAQVGTYPASNAVLVATLTTKDAGTGRGPWVQRFPSNALDGVSTVAATQTKVGGWYYVVNADGTITFGANTKTTAVKASDSWGL